MDPSSRRPAVAFGPGEWKVYATRGLHGVAVGSEIEVKRSGDEWVFNTWVGKVGSVAVATTTVSSDGSYVLVDNAAAGISLKLAPLHPVISAPPPWTAPWGKGDPPATLTRAYRGQPEAAAALMREEANRLKSYGYVAVSQNFAPGSWSLAAWVIAFLLFVFIVGIIILVYLIAAHPDGTLTVVYERRVGSAVANVAASQVASATRSASTVEERLRLLDDLRQKGIVNDDEYAAKRAAILADL